MGRFYQTAEPRFLDYVVEPNLDLEMSLAQADVQGDMLKKQVAKFDPNFSITHEEFDNEKAQSIVNEVNQRVGDIASKLKDPNKSTREAAQAEMRNYRKELMDSYTSGPLNEILRNVDAADSYRKALEDAETQEEKATISAIYNYKLGDIKGGKTSRLNYEEALRLPDELSNEKVIEALGKLSPYSRKQSIQKSDGFYFVTDSGSLEKVGQDRLATTMDMLWRSTPGVQDYMKQQQAYGMQEFYERNPETGEIMWDRPIQNYTLDEKGNLTGISNNILGSKIGLATRYTVDKEEKGREIDTNAQLFMDRRQQRGFGFEREKDIDIVIPGIVKTYNKNTGNLFAGLQSSDKAMQTVAETTFNNMVENLPEGLKKYAPELKEEIKNKNLNSKEDITGYLFNKKYPTFEDFKEKAGFDIVKEVDNLEKASSEIQKNHGLAYIEKKEKLFKDLYESYKTGDSKIVSIFMDGHQADLADVNFDKVEKEMQNIYKGYNDALSNIYANVESYSDGHFINSSWVENKEENNTNHVYSTAILNNLKNNASSYEVLKTKEDDKTDFTGELRGNKLPEITDVLEGAQAVTYVGGTAGDAYGTLVVIDKKGKEVVVGLKDVNHPSFRNIVKIGRDKGIIPSDSSFLKEMETGARITLGRDLKKIKQNYLAQRQAAIDKGEDPDKVIPPKHPEDISGRGYKIQPIASGNYNTLYNIVDDTKKPGDPGYLIASSVNEQATYKRLKNIENGQ